MYLYLISSLFQTLYSLLPALLDTNPFSSEERKKGKAGAKDRAGSEGEGDEEEDVSTLPPTVAGLVEVYRCSLQLSREACLSPPLTSQTFGYLFFFTNTSLLNTLLERGENLQSFINTIVFAHGFEQRWQKLTCDGNEFMAGPAVWCWKWFVRSILNRQSVLLVTCGSNSNKSGPGSRLATRSRPWRYCIRVSKETISYSQFPVHT